ncbi:hypothetical protein [Bradyrhizobium erythrophlei]|uniref:hypothetical protein n=1 Tax=Bradyrhizobium erythrophlei TaxID=1437360 RepID=UPI0009A83A1D|nr:hypothetical protein [Bradyrhizobium erythrophlei]
MALSISASARALGIRSEHIQAALENGDLVCRSLGPRRRIAVFGEGGLQEWFLTWPRYTKKMKGVPHG